MTTCSQYPAEEEEEEEEKEEEEDKERRRRSRFNVGQVLILNAPPAGSRR